MKDNTTILKKVQDQIKRFSYRMTKGLSKPKKRFVSQALYGIQLEDIEEDTEDKKQLMFGFT